MMRLDVYLVEKGFAQSRERAKDNILHGLITVNGNVILKPSFQIDENAKVEFNSADAMPFVGKGGLKLEKAINNFNLDFNGKYVLDVGASTGGFTHCALQHGAEFVWAVDVGTNQLDKSLRNHPQVCSMEECDVRTLSVDAIKKKVDYIIADLSFISLTIVAPHLPKFLSITGSAMLLIKPQFEVGREFLNKNGIAKNPKLHFEAINRIVECYKMNGLHLQSINNAPILDSKKNIEYITLFSFSNPDKTFDFKEIINNAFLEQKKLK